VQRGLYLSQKGNRAGQARFTLTFGKSEGRGFEDLRNEKNNVKKSSHYKSGMVKELYLGNRRRQEGVQDRKEKTFGKGLGILKLNHRRGTSEFLIPLHEKRRATSCSKTDASDYIGPKF